MTREFIYMPEFDKQWKNCGMTLSLQRELEVFLCEHPQAGDMIQGTGGLRKIRWAFPGGGKSGGVRVLYVDFPAFEKAFFITCFPKSVKISLNQQEKQQVKALIDEIKRGLRGMR